MISTLGKVKIFNKSGVRFEKFHKPVGLIVDVIMDSPNQKWQILLGANFMFAVGNFVSSVGRDPWGCLMNTSGSIEHEDRTIPNRVFLNLIPENISPILSVANLNIKAGKAAVIRLPAENSGLFSNSFYSQVDIDENEQNTRT